MVASPSNRGPTRAVDVIALHASIRAESAGVISSEESSSSSVAPLLLSRDLISGDIVKPKTTRLRLPLLTSLSAFVELEATTKKFETLAGRMAMLGVTVALAVEAIYGAPIVSLARLSSLGQVVSPDLGEELFVSALICAISFASLLAIESMSWSGKRGQLLLEGVVASPIGRGLPSPPSGGRRAPWIWRWTRLSRAWMSLLMTRRKR